MELTLVSGSQEKIQAWRRLMPASITLVSVPLNQVEIQPESPMDTEAIVRDKVQRAYTVLQRPVVVEDVSAGLDSLNHFPGPYIKAAEAAMGGTALWILANGVEQEAHVSCTAAYFDGEREIIVSASQKGRVVAPRGTGWGFDRVFVPTGHDKTFAEMGAAAKDRVGYRADAVRNLLSKIENLPKI